MAHRCSIRMACFAIGWLLICRLTAAAQDGQFNPDNSMTATSIGDQSASIGWGEFQRSWVQLDRATWATYLEPPPANQFAPALGQSSGGSFVELRQVGAQYSPGNETPADQLNGIDAMGAVYFHCVAFRIWDSSSGWSSWQNCSGPIMEVLLHRQNGQWYQQVAANWQNTSRPNPNDVPGEMPPPPAPAVNPNGPCQPWETWDAASGTCRQSRAHY